jgi:hypothetical protein
MQSEKQCVQRESMQSEQQCVASRWARSCRGRGQVSDAKNHTVHTTHTKHMCPTTRIIGGIIGGKRMAQRVIWHGAGHQWRESVSTTMAMLTSTSMAMLQRSTCQKSGVWRVVERRCGGGMCRGVCDEDVQASPRQKGGCDQSQRHGSAASSARLRSPCP